MSQKQKTLRAFCVYFELLDTADYMLGWMRGPLNSFDLTMQGFRLLEMIYREGAISMVGAAKVRGCKRQNLRVLVGRLEKRGWVKRFLVARPPAKIRQSQLPIALRGLPRHGRRMAVVVLTPLGRKFIGDVLPNHAKVVKALMRALEGREQDTLVRICRKLREGDPVRFYSEMIHADLNDAFQK